MIWECFSPWCAEPAVVEAIGRFDDRHGGDATVAFLLCQRHADALRDEEDVVLLEAVDA